MKTKKTSNYIISKGLSAICLLLVLFISTEVSGNNFGYDDLESSTTNENKYTFPYGADNSSAFDASFTQTSKLNAGGLGIKDNEIELGGTTLADPLPIPDGLYIMFGLIILYAIHLFNNRERKTD